MKVLVTGSAGRIGRAIYIKLMKQHSVVGIDKTPCSTVDFVGDIRDLDLLAQALKDVDVIVHTAALHAPHVGLVDDDEFKSINVSATENLALLGIKSGIQHLVFTSTTALYGHASTPDGIAGWINESVVPQPKTIYHRTKIEAEHKLQTISQTYRLPITVLQMSRCFPEPADAMAIYRLTRGIDARDVANAHLCAIDKRLNGFNRFIISGKTPFTPEDCKQLYNDARTIIKDKCPQLASEFEQRKWNLPNRLDRVYDSASAQSTLDWIPNHDFEDVLEMLDSEFSEVIPRLAFT